MRTLLIFILSVASVGCTIRERVGEDIKSLTDAEKEAVVRYIVYVKDTRTNLCFAVLNQNADGFRNTFSITNVPCDKVGY